MRHVGRSATVGVVGAAGLLGLVLLGLVEKTDAHMGDGGDPNQIHACGKVSGKLRNVGPTGSCKGSETALHWGIQGPQGEQGLQGLQGPPGVLGSFDELEGLPCTAQAGQQGTVKFLTVAGPGPTLVCAVAVAGQFVDLGLSVYDTQTKLMWEKKNGSGGGQDLGNPHDLDNLYHWCQATGIASGGCGGSITPPSWIAQVNAEGGTGYLGYDDWRVPIIGELQTIVDCNFSPCINPLFSPIPLASFWWSSTLTANPDRALGVEFFDGSATSIPVLNTVRVRAVRGPLP